MVSLAVWTACTVALGPCSHQGPRDTLRVYAVGDINLGRRVAMERLLQGDTLYPSAVVLDTLRAAHILFGNLESPIAPPAHRVETTGTVFTAPPLAAQSLALAGFDIVSTANNHQWDGGRGGVEETMRQLTRAGVLFVGSGLGRQMAEQPVIVRLSAILRLDAAPNGSLRVSAIPVRAGLQAQFVDGAAADSIRRRLNLPRSRKAGTT